MKPSADLFASLPCVEATATCLAKPVKAKKTAASRAKRKRQAVEPIYSGPPSATDHQPRLTAIPLSAADEALDQRCLDVLDLIIDFDEELGEAFEDLILDMLDDLADLPDTPLRRGKTESWAAGVLFALMRLNFEPTRGGGDAARVADALGVGPSYPATKAREIEKLLDIEPFDARYCVMEVLAHHPAADTMVTPGGFLAPLSVLWDMHGVEAIGQMLDSGTIRPLHKQAFEAMLQLAACEYEAEFGDGNGNRGGRDDDGPPRGA
ncbi:MAG: DUF6398 domain-containing protein [Planctomycetota bacterium]